jgi:D-alanyl-D-alanine dipeptidase
MKRICGILLILLLLFYGCGREEQETLPSQLETVFHAETISESSIQPETLPSTTVATIAPEPEESDFVLVSDFIPNIVIDLKYATTDNFTGQVIYESDETYLRYGTVKKLIQVQLELEKLGLSLKLWDGYRPPAAQYKLWDICPDANYVSDPNKGFSSHSRGNTVDVTLVDLNGLDVDMPTGFDDFTKRADRDYSDCSRNQRENALLLEELMTRYGFKPYAKEWWHFSDTVKYEVAYDINEGADS